MKTRLLIVDPMPLARKVLTELFANSHEIELLGSVSGSRPAERIVRQQMPDVILFDIEPPDEIELNWFKDVREKQKIPLIYFSATHPEIRHLIVKSLALRSSEMISKPESKLAEATLGLREQLELAIRKAAQHHRLDRRTNSIPSRAGSSYSPPRRNQIVVIGASTGGTEAIATIISQLPRDCPGIVMVQHMPSGYTRQFANRLNDLGGPEVREAVDGDEVRPGLALLAPGGVQMSLVPGPNGFLIRFAGEQKVNGHCPSVDVLMQAAARLGGTRVVGVLLTGMGNDGAHGLKAIQVAGGGTIAQDQATSVVYGMPREAVRIGAAERVFPLNEIAKQILNFASRHHCKSIQ